MQEQLKSLESLRLGNKKLERGIEEMKRQVEMLEKGRRESGQEEQSQIQISRERAESLAKDLRDS